MRRFIDIACTTAAALAAIAMVLPAAALVAVSCLLTVVAGPLYDVSAAAAAELRDRAVYVSAVLGPDAATSLGERP